MNSRLLALSLGSLSPLALAAGFQLQERSASGLGRAFSGEAAMADDASVLASNPAAMLLLSDEWSFALGGSGIFPEVEVRGTYAPPAPAPPGTRLPAYGGNVSDDAFVPFFHAVKQVNERLAIGVGSYTTFGLNSNYPTPFPARAVADSSEVLTLNLNPSLAWRIDERWSLGLGFDALYAKGKLTATARPCHCSTSRATIGATASMPACCSRRRRPPVSVCTTDRRSISISKVAPSRWSPLSTARPLWRSSSRTAWNSVPSMISATGRSTAT
jgi:long-subunit fatty acid transport protein